MRIAIFAEPDVKLPVYQTEGSSGADVSAYIDEPITLKPRERFLVATGISMEIPKGYEVQVRPRSGLAVKYGITVLNTPGTIDSDYRGEIKVCLINLGNEDFVINNGDRIAQFIVAPVTTVWYTKKGNNVTMTVTKRGKGGFGHTGVN